MNKLKITFFIVTFFWLSLFFVLFFNFTPFNPIRYKTSNLNTNLQFFLPQGWGFFTRNPREEIVQVYEYIENHWELITIPNSSPQRVFGISKKQRRIGLDLTFLLSELQDNEWHTTLGNPVENQYQISDTLKGNFEFLNGPLLITKHNPIPWAWNSLASVSQSTQFLTIYVENI